MVPLNDWPAFSDGTNFQEVPETQLISLTVCTSAYQCDRKNRVSGSSRGWPFSNPELSSLFVHTSVGCGIAMDKRESHNLIVGLSLPSP